MLSNQVRQPLANIPQNGELYETIELEMKISLFYFFYFNSSWSMCNAEIDEGNMTVEEFLTLQCSHIIAVSGCSTLRLC